jgi:hypothetical protein
LNGEIASTAKWYKGGLSQSDILARAGMGYAVDGSLIFQ